MGIKAGYVRLSKDEDGESYQSIIEQRNIITRYYRETLKYLDEIIWFEDNDYSGYTNDRPDFNKLADLVSKNCVDIVLCKNISRFGRNNANILNDWDKFIEGNTRVICIMENIDSNDPASRNNLGLWAWISEQAVRQSSINVISHFRERQLNGDIIFNVPFGYYKTCEELIIGKKKKKINVQIHIDEKTSKIIQEIFFLYINGFGFRKISDILNKKNYPTPSSYKNTQNSTTIWTSISVKNILVNDFYIGTLTCKKTYKKSIKGKSYLTPKDEVIKHENSHISIISKESFELVQKIMNNKVKHNARGSKGMCIHLFSGKIFCNKCGKNYVYLRSYKKKQDKYLEYYTCGTKHKLGKKYCDNINIVEYKLINSLKNIFINKIKESEEVIQLIKNKLQDNRQEFNYEKEIIKLEKSIASTKNKIEINYRNKINVEETLKETGVEKIPIEIIDGDILRLTTELRELQTQIKLYKEKANEIDDKQNNLERQIDLYNKFLELDLTKKDIEEYIDKIVIDKDNEEFISVYLNY